MSARPVVTRFAPSPTGRLTAGNARTALFAWAFARRHGGRFILRIEDTDRARSTAASTRGIIADLRWLGLDWDEGPVVPADWAAALADAYDPQGQQTGGHGPYLQSQRLDIYRAQVQRLLDAGLAYRCFRTTQELAAERDAAAAAGRPYRYDPTPSLALGPDRIAELEAQGRPCVVRFRMPDADIEVPDVVRGLVRFRAAEYEDFVMLKADGFPTFHLAVTVDDSLMGVTHVLRAQDHLANTPRHWALQTALGYEHPVYVHLPLIFNPDGSKMSKRDKAKVARSAVAVHFAKLDEPARQEWIRQLQQRPDATQPPGEGSTPGLALGDILGFLEKRNDEVAVAQRIAGHLRVALPEIDIADYRASGYLPAALVNYLALLGWSPGADLERFGPDPLGLLRARFDLDRVSKSNARFDREKLFRFNAEAIAALPEAEFRQRLFQRGGAAFHAAFAGVDDPRLVLFARAYQPRARTLSEPERIGGFFLVADAELVYNDGAVAKVLAADDGQGFGVLEVLRTALAGLARWEQPALDQALQEQTERQRLAIAKVVQPLRVALSGGTASPPIDQVLLILGRQSTLARIGRCLALRGERHVLDRQR